MPRPLPTASVASAAASAARAPAPAGGLHPVEEALAHVVRCALPHGAGPVLLGVSGGSDSTAMLRAAAACGTGTAFHVVHVDHGLRPESGADARAVEQLAATLGLPASVVPAPPEGPGDARTETSARRRRYAAFRQTALSLGACALLLAHHDDDDLETIALRTQRGHHGDLAQAGMPARRPLDVVDHLTPGAGTPLLVRPFLLARTPDGHALGRADLSDYRHRHGLPVRDDASNADLTIPRNAVRAELSGEGGDARRAELHRQRCAARERILRRRQTLASRLERDVGPDGLGTLVASRAWTPGTDDDADEHRAELLRLLGLCLARPRRLDPRATVLERLDRALRAGSGALHLPAQPEPLSALVSSAGLHLLDEPPRAVSSAARALTALAASAWHR